MFTTTMSRADNQSLPLLNLKAILDVLVPMAYWCIDALNFI